MSNWRDEFSSLDTDRWGTSTSGSGSVSATGGKLTINAPAVADAALAYLKEKIDKTEDHLYLIGYADPTLADDADGRIHPFLVWDVPGSTPAVGTGAAVSGFYRISCYIYRSAASTYTLGIAYYDSVGAWHYWDGSSWAVSGTIESLSSTPPRYFYIETSSTRGWRIMVSNAANTRWITITDWVAWSSLYSPTSDLYIVVGDPLTDYYKGQIEVEFVEYFDSLEGLGMLNGRAKASPDANYSLFRANIFRADFGVRAFPWEDRMVDSGDFPGGSGVTHVAWPYPIEYDGTTYIFCAGYDGSNWDIWYFTTTDGGDTITRPQDTALVAHGGVGWRQNNVGLPVVYRDPDDSDPAKRWKMLVYGLDASGNYTIGLYYAADPPGSGDWTWTEYGSNPVISEGGGSSWIETGLFPSKVIRVDSSYLLEVTGYDGSVDGSLGYYTSSDFINWTPYASNPYYTKLGSKTADLIANVSAGGTSINVDSTNFAVGDIVLLYDNNSGTGKWVVDINRIMAIPDSTHVTLAEGVNRDFTTALSAKMRSILYRHSANMFSFTEEAAWIGFQAPYAIFNDMTYPDGNEFTVFMIGTNYTDWAIDNEYTPIVPLHPYSATVDGYMAMSCENLKLVLQVDSPLPSSGGILKYPRDMRRHQRMRANA